MKCISNFNENEKVQYKNIKFFHKHICCNALASPIALGYIYNSISTTAASRNFHKKKPIWLQFPRDSIIQD